MKDRVSISINDHVAHVRLIRADKMNALDPAMFEALSEAGQQLAASPEVRAVVLSGDGKAFCAGLDMQSVASMVSDDGNATKLAPRTHGIANGPQHIAWVWRELKVPVIAALHGVAFGGGFQVALGADIRYAAPGTRLSIMEIKWGIVPDMAGTQLMRHLARDDVIRELTYTGRIFTAEEAVDYGFVTRLCDDPLANALETAKYIAGRNPDAIQAGKQLLNQANYLQADAGLLMESELQDSIIGTPNQLEAVMAEMEKRPANFVDS